MQTLRKMLGKLSAPAKASIAFVVINIIQKGVAFLSTPIYTRILSQADYGASTVYFSVMQIVGVFAMFSLHAGVFNNGMVEFREDRDNYMFSTLVLSNLITLAVAGLCGLFFDQIGALLGVMDAKYWYLMFAIFLFQPAFHFWTARQRYEYKYKALGLITVASSVASCALAIAAIRMGGGDPVAARLFGAEIPLLIVYAAFYVLLFLRGGLKVNWKYVRFAFLFNLPLLPHYLSIYVMNSADRVMIQNLVGPEQAALYSVAYSITSIITLVWTAINSSLTPYVYESCKAGNEKRVAPAVLPILLGYGLMCFGVILFAPEVIALLGPEAYQQAIYVVPPLICGVFFQSFYSVFAMILYYNKRPVYAMIASITGAGLNLVLNALLIPRYGYVAAGYTTMLSFAVQAAIDYAAMQKVSHGRIYSGRVFLLLGAAMLALTLAANLLYGHTLLRYGVILLMLAVAVWKRKTILHLLQAIRKRK